jgi:hypothetical protein
MNDKLVACINVDQDESFDRTASHMTTGYATYKTKLTAQELLEVLQDLDFVTDNWSDCAAAISKKEQEK